MTVGHQSWQPRSIDRLPEAAWRATLSRIRGEFDEMPCLRLTLEQARILFGLSDPSSQWVLDRLAAEGFLARTPQGEYMKAFAQP